MTGADPADNDRNLEWVLSRMQGEVGVTGASDGLRGERFAAAPGSIGPVLRELARARPAVCGPAAATRPCRHPPSRSPLVVDDRAERGGDRRAARRARAGGPRPATGVGWALRPRAR